MQYKSHSSQSTSIPSTQNFQLLSLMKRIRYQGDQEEIKTINMANVLMLLSHGSSSMNMSQVDEQKVFGSFQALGGHRASHKIRKMALNHDGDHNNQSLATNTMPKVHECSICGVGFAIGQALGGHMRRHRATINEEFVEKKTNNIGKKRVMLFGFELPIQGDDPL